MEEPEASLDNQGNALKEALNTASCLASVNAKVPRGHDTLSLALIGPPLSLLFFAALVANGQRVLLLTRAWRHSLDNACALSLLFD